MPEISFALILNDNLKNKHLKIKQVESVIEVTGKLDPYQLQKIRDHVSQSFQDRRKLINDLIAGKAKEAERTKDKKKQAQIIEDVDAAIAKSAAAFDKKIQASVTAFCEQDTEMQKAAESGNWKYFVSTAWKAGNLLWDATGVAGDVAESNVIGSLKGLLDLTINLYKFANEQRDAWRGLEEQEKRLVTALDAIRKVKKGQPIGQSLVDKAETALGPLGPKIDVMENGARKIAANLDELLKKQSSGVLKGRKQIKELEKLIQSAVVEVATIGTGVAAKRDVQKRAKDSIRTAATKAKTDPMTILKWALDYYDKFNTAMDHYDLMKPTDTLEKLAKDMRTLVNTAIEEAEDD